MSNAFRHLSIVTFKNKHTDMNKKQKKNIPHTEWENNSKEKVIERKKRIKEQCAILFSCDEMERRCANCEQTPSKHQNEITHFLKTWIYGMVSHEIVSSSFLPFFRFKHTILIQK